MKKLNKIMGKRAEVIAKNYLEKKGHKLLAENFKTKFGEIDLITKKENTIHFVEVKSRVTEDFGHPALAVGKKKQEKIIKVGEYFLLKIKREDMDIQFDVISIINKGSFNDIQYIENAFDLPPEV